MPNWVSCSIKFENEVDATRVKDFMKTEENDFDFNQLVPMPPALNLDHGSITYSAMKAAQGELTDIEIASLLSRNLHVGDGVIATKNDLIALGKKYIENQKNYEHTDWYMWCVSNWGTKWNACDVYLEETTIYFETAWSAPLPIFKKLIEKFSDIKLVIQWAEEQFDYYTGQILTNGKGWFEINEPEAYSFEAFCLACMVWDPDQEQHRWDPLTNKSVTYYYWDEDEGSEEKILFESLSPIVLPQVV